MKKTTLLVLIFLLGQFILTACVPPSEPVLPTVTPSISPRPTVEKSLPTPISPKQAVVYENLQVVMSQAEITSSYLTEFGSSREPPAGEEFLWIQIILVNTGQEVQDMPAPEHFSVLNATTEFKPTYGHRKDHLDYMTLSTGIVQGQIVDAWLRFEIPTALELKDLTFVFMPESSQVSVGFSTSDYPVGDHPFYLWLCAP